MSTSGPTRQLAGDVTSGVWSALQFEMRAKDTCPSCGAKVSPDDLLCANCELILDANLIPDQPSNGDFSVVRRMLEVPQPGLPSQRPARPATPPPTQGNEGPTRVFALGRTRGIPMVVASLTRRAAALSELEAFVVSFIDGESDLDTLAERSGIRSFEMGVVLQALNDKMIVDFADESLQEDEDEEAEAPAAEEPPTEALATVSPEPRSAPTVLMKPVDPSQLGPPPTVRMEPIRLEAPRPAPTELLEPVRLPQPNLDGPAETGDVTPPGEASVDVSGAPSAAQTLEPAPTPPPAVAEPAATPPPAPAQPFEPAPTPPPAAQAFEPAPTPPPPAPLPPPVEGRRRSMKLRPSLPGPPPGEKPPPPVPTPPAPEGRAPAATPPAPATPPPAAPPPPPRTPPVAAMRPPAIAPVPPRRNTVETRQEPAIGSQPIRSTVETRQEPAVGSQPVRSTVETRQEPAVDPQASGVIIDATLDEEASAPHRPSSSWVLTSVTASTRPELRVEPSIIVAPHATPPEVPEVALAAPPPSRPRRTLPAGSRSTGSRPAPPLKLDSTPGQSATRGPAQTQVLTPVASAPVQPKPAPTTVPQSAPVPPKPAPASPTAQASVPGPKPAPAPATAPQASVPGPSQAFVPVPPKPMPPKTQPMALDVPEPQHEGTDPRIVHRGGSRVNRKVLDALKQVKRRDTAPEVSSEPSVDEILADKLAAGSLQVAIRMEQNGRLDEAIRYLENSIAKSPDAPSLYNRLAIILMRERADLRRAEQLLQKANDLAPGHEVYEKNLAAVLAKRAMKK